MRILLSVGCDSYSHAPSLNGAVKDAERIFLALVGEQEHQYDKAHSRLLISPSTQSFRTNISDILYDNPDISVFTLYFAGHASVFDETLYLAFSDALPDRIAATTIGFPEVLRATAGARPKQANFILDACNAGGLGFDIGSILKRTIVGNSDTMGISFIASAAAEQYASETKDGGNFTIEFEKTLRGETFVQKAKPFLSLSEIAHQVQGNTKLKNQAISYWTLNLQGPNLFAKNPHFSGPSDATDRIVSQLQKQKVKLGERAADFKSAIVKLAMGVDETKLSKTLESVFSEIDPEQRSSLIYGLADGLSAELADANDSFLETRVRTVLCGQILGLCHDDGGNRIIDEMIAWYLEANRRALSKLSKAMTADKNALLSGGFSDLYELPIRISDVFGQCALLLFGQRKPRDCDSDLVLSVVRQMLAQYGNSVLALTDDQATGYLLFLEMCRRKSWFDVSEEVLGRLYYDLHRNFGRCGDYSLIAKDQFALLAERYEYSYSITRDLYKFPSDLVTVILSFTALHSLDEAVDFTLIDIDHTSINYFVPDKLDRFGLADGLDGANYTLTVGRDFWRCVDLRRTLRGDILPKFHSAAEKLSWEENFCAIAGALALRDRLPWHIVDQPL
jgi:hypothetical protein